MPNLVKYLNSFLASPRLRRVLNYNLPAPENMYKNIAGGAALGSTTGGIGGVISTRDETDSRKKIAKILKYSLIGGGSGIIAGKYGPSLASKAFGRVATNIVNPAGYSLKEHLGDLKNYSLKSLLGAVQKDETIFGLDRVTPQRRMAAREALFREMYDLPSRSPTASDVFTPLKKVDKTKHIRKVWTLNPQNETGKAEMQSLGNSIKSLYKHNPESVTKGGGDPGAGFLLGGVHYYPGGRYEDKWDFALNPGELPKGKLNALRILANMFSSPVVVVGNATG